MRKLSPSLWHANACHLKACIAAQPAVIQGHASVFCGLATKICTQSFEEILQFTVRGNPSSGDCA